VVYRPGQRISGRRGDIRVEPPPSAVLAPSQRRCYIKKEVVAQALRLCLRRVGTAHPFLLKQKLSRSSSWATQRVAPTKTKKGVPSRLMELPLPSGAIANHHQAGLLALGSPEESSLPAGVSVASPSVAGVSLASSVPHHSGGTAPDSHRVPDCLEVLIECMISTPLGLCQDLKPGIVNKDQAKPSASVVTHFESRRATISSISQRRSVTPASIAGVTLRLL